MSGAPLDPGGDDGRSLLRRELLRPEYRDDDPLGRLLAWAGRQLDRGVEAAAGLPALSTVVACVVLVALVVLLAVLLSRVRRTRAAAAAAPVPVGAGALRAADWRDRARVALAERRDADALVDGFRALAADHVERRLVEDRPGATAREVALAVAAVRPAHRDDLLRAGTWFDEARYGRRAVSHERAEAVLDLDARLAAGPHADRGGADGDRSGGGPRPPAVAVPR